MVRNISGIDFLTHSFSHSFSNFYSRQEFQKVNILNFLIQVVSKLSWTKQTNEHNLHFWQMRQVQAAKVESFVFKKNKIWHKCKRPFFECLVFTSIVDMLARNRLRRLHTATAWSWIFLVVMKYKTVSGN